jgi:hypothetical protein
VVSSNKDKEVWIKVVARPKDEKPEEKPHKHKIRIYVIYDKMNDVCTPYIECVLPDCKFHRSGVEITQYINQLIDNQKE